jgi:hypothetical protein
MKKTATPSKADRAETSAMASAPVTEQPAFARAPRVIPAKASLSKKFGNKKKLTQPAVLIFWQETYDDGQGNVIQRSYWRVVVLSDIPKEQPKRT